MVAGWGLSKEEWVGGRFWCWLVVLGLNTVAGLCHAPPCGVRAPVLVEAL